MDSSRETDAELRTRFRQQEIVAELGQQALDTGDLDQLMHDAAVAVGEALETDYSAILQFSPTGDSAVLREGIGWQEPLTDGARIRTDPDTHIGYTRRQAEPTIVEELRADGRFADSEFLAGHDVSSGIGVPVGSPDDPWGVFCVYTIDRRTFAEYEATFVRSVANVLGSTVANHRTQTELEEIYGRISDAFFALDEDWQFTHLNERAHELINPDERTLVGKTIWEEFPEAISRKFESKYEHAMYEQETVSFEEYYPEPLDEWFEVRAYPSETGLSVYFRDITDRKERERALRQSEQRYRTLAEAFPNGIVTLFDENLEYTLVAGQAFDYLPVSPDDVTGKTPHDAWGGDVADDLESLCRGALDGEKRSVETAYADREWVVYAVPLTDETGRVFAGMTMAQNITERKENQRRLETQNERLESFASMLAHELRNPVNIGQIYSRQLPADANAEAVDYVTEAFDRIENMIDVMLVLARGQRAVDKKTAIDLASVTREAWADIDARDATLDVELDHMTIEADETYLRHLFRNILENAVEHGGDDVTVTVGALPDGFYVADDGTGIPADERETIFDEGYTTASDGGGTGLGLAFVQKLADVYGWDYAVVDSVAGGARFEFTDVTSAPD